MFRLITVSVMCLALPACATSNITIRHVYTGHNAVGIVVDCDTDDENNQICAETKSQLCPFEYFTLQHKEYFDTKKNTTRMVSN